MAATIPMALTGAPELLAACAPGVDPPGLSWTMLPAGDQPPAEAELVVALGASESALEPLLAPAAPPLVAWLAVGDLPPQGLRPRDRLIAATAGTPGAWRTLAMPVADALYAQSPLAALAGRARWLGKGGPRRREYVGRHGKRIEDGSQARLTARASSAAAHGGAGSLAPSVVVNLPEAGQPSVGHELAAALAGGCLRVSETLAPAHGLEPGVAYLVARDPDDVFIATENALRRPQAYRRIQLAGRRKAEWFRSSLVLGRIARDLRRELAASV
ncbi:MAG TPA: hypothetical protein VI111_11545 [Thermoleophilaceae bacterium]